MFSETFDLVPSAQWGYIAPVEDTDDPLKVLDVVLPVQTHTANIGILTHPSQRFPETDALITQLKGVAIGVRTADCVPILMYAPDIEAIAAVHAGWKGTIAGIALKTFHKLIEMGADPAKIQVRTGVHICKDCYQIDDDLAEKFRSAGFGDSLTKGEAFDFLENHFFNPQKNHLDLGFANYSLLRDAGLNPHNHQYHQSCTRHTPVASDDGRKRFLPSWRRNPGETRRIISWIRLN